MARSRLYVARDERATIVSRERLRVSGSRVVRRPWSTLVETTAPSVADLKEGASPHGTMLVVLPPLAVCAVVSTFGTLELGLASGGAVFFGIAYVEPALRRRIARKGMKPAPAAALTLRSENEREAFARAVSLADSISRTWPQLGDLIDVPEAESMLAEALWEIAAVLARHQQLTAVLADLSRPDFVAQSPSDETALELRTQRQATERALATLELDLARRDSGLRRALQAGREFIREQQMREAIRAARESLGTDQPAVTNETPSDAAAELADHTRTVLDAYRELTDGLHPDPPQP
ncbi:hypothetical protein KOI35_02085 [Actinoplanes bogorensis]|uniref:Uncharacterized protein n=1 Tax=Paractinoplanes bogorensis TaxID=1610840 RepID=A0ABS5YFP1_9ACTN|nr:hypothetical protein [Actinoplanes bogorensis]MBU2662289.1 hypothetical protein [Actinoplanes bogorensis]